MNTYPNAANGLQKMFYAQIVVIIGAVLAIIPFIGGILGIICSLAGMVLQLWGLNMAANDDNGYKNAFTLTIVNMVVNLLSSVLSSVPFLSSLLDFASSVLSLIILYLVLQTSAKLLNNAGHSDVANMGKAVWILNVVSLVASLVMLIMALFALLGLDVVVAVLTGIVGFLAGIISIVAGIMYIVFLYKASKAL